MQPYEKAGASRKYIILNNFIGGIAWAFGATVGLGIVFVILGVVLKSAILVPIVGTFVSEVANFVLQNNPQLIQ